MRQLICTGFGLAMWFMAGMSMAQDPGVAKPELVVQEAIRGMPRNKTQDVRIMTGFNRSGTEPLRVVIFLRQRSQHSISRSGSLTSYFPIANALYSVRPCIDQVRATYFAGLLFVQPAPPRR